MSDYTKTVDFAAKDALASGNANKIVKGTEIDTEFDNIATAVATKFDSTDRGAADGIASLDSSTLVPVAQLPAATTSANGVVELATTAEVVTGTDSTRAVTSDGVQAVLDQNAGILNDISTMNDPGQDRIAFWDDSLSEYRLTLVPSSPLAINDTALEWTHLGIESLSDPGADRIMMWDDSATAVVFGNVTNGLSFSGANIVLSNVTAGAAQPVNILSGVHTFDLSSITEITMPNFSQSQDKFVVSDNGTIKVLPYDEAGIKVATVTGTTDTLAAGDMNTFIEYTNASAVTVTLNTGVGTVGNVVLIKQTGAGQVTVSGTATFESAVGEKTRTTDSVISLVCIAANTWAVFGDTAA